MKYLHMKTSLGDIKIELDEANAPITVANFLSYVESKHFDDCIFHRVIPNFVIQGGGFNPQMQEKPTQKPIQNEAKNGLKNKRGTLSMARTNDPHSATSQFFMNLADNDFLDQNGEKWGYAVFGKIVDGLEVIDNIAKVKTGSHGFHQDVPATPIVIECTQLLQT